MKFSGFWFCELKQKHANWLIYRNTLVGISQLSIKAALKIIHPEVLFLWFVTMAMMGKY